MEPLALSSDELRALARMVGAPVSAVLLEDDDLLAGPIADAVAIRGLLARGLVVVDLDGAPLPSPELAEELAAVLDPVSVADVEQEVGGLVARAVVVEGAGGVTTLTEREPDVWVVGTAEGYPDAVLALARPTPGATPPSGRRLVVPVEAHQEADDLLAEGDSAGAVAALVDGGADAAVAEAFVAAVKGRTRSVVARIARRLGPDTYAATEVRYLEAGPLGTWRSSVEDETGGSEDDDEIGSAFAGGGLEGGGGTSVAEDVGAEVVEGEIVGALRAPDGEVAAWAG